MKNASAFLPVAAELHIQWFDLTTGPFEECVGALIRSLRTREME